MSFTTDPDIRQPFVTGLRDLADYLARHPHLVVPAHGTQILLSAASADDCGCAQVDRFARQLGVPVENSLAYDGHYRAVRGGPTLRGVVLAFLFLMAVAAFSGALLASL